MQRFFVDHAPKDGKVVITDKEQIRQITKVLRLQTGDRSIVIFDGMEYEVTWKQLDSKTALGDVVDSRMGLALNHEVVLCVALLKNDKLEWVVQKATELGVGRIMLMKTKHCVKQEASDSFVTRLRKIAQEAAEQSEGAQVPSIDAPVSFEQAIARANEYGKAYLLHERGGQSFGGISKGVFMVGPEGGFDESEFLLATSKGVTMVSLGKRILRAETAAIAVLAKVLL